MNRRPSTVGVVCACILVVALGACGASGERSLPRPDLPGLQATSEGELRKDGRPYRGVGVNYFDAFYRTVKDADDTSYDAGLATLAEMGIPFARVMAGGYWPSEQRLYLDDPEEFFRRFDRFVRSAEQHDIGLVLTLFWHTATVPDLVGEPVRAWGDPASRTRAHMRRYVRDVVRRYRESPSVWAWELGNEWSLAASLPNASEQRPPTHPALGTPPSRTSADELTVEDARAAFVAFVREVRRHDTARIVSSGNSIPRDSAWHNWRDRTWTPDTPEQTAEMIRDDNPMDVVSVHAYGVDIPRVAHAAEVSREAGKPLFLGEFGAPGPGRTGERDLRAALRIIERYDVDLAALWVYDHADQPEWTVTATNGRGWQLRAVAAANAALSDR